MKVLTGLGEGISLELGGAMQVLGSRLMQGCPNSRYPFVLIKTD